MSAHVITFSAAHRPATCSHIVTVSSSVTILADHRDALKNVRVTLDPLVFARSWLDFWAGRGR